MADILEQLTKTRIRSVKVTLELLNEKDEIVLTDFDVFYKSRNTREIRNALESVKEENLYIADVLANRLVKLVSKDGEEIFPTIELLDGIELDNLKLIEKAINGNADPK